MTVDIAPAPSVRATPEPSAAPPAARARRALARPVVMSVVLLLLYAGCSLLDDPHAFLGTDTGGKVATLRAMDHRGDLDPDLGYWAERFDPDGVAHPIALNTRIGDQWVNVTTLPMVYAAVPLYELGGLRAILLLPMVGGVLTALAARALARRLGGSGALAFWLVGLATPIAVYALDFWEHTLGTAAMLWAIVLLLDATSAGRRGRLPAWALAGGGAALFGVAATMRTEALVYAVVTFAVVGVVLVRDRRADVLRVGAACAVGLVVPLLANHLLETLVLGSGLRAGRASSAAAGGGGSNLVRLEEALTTSIGVNHYRPLAFDWIVGGLVALCVFLAMLRFLDRDPRRRPVAYALLAIAAVLVAFRFSDGLGFLPGLFVASPLAAAGLAVLIKDRRVAPLGAIALAALPLVWLFQYSGGAFPQWGGRYVLVSGLLLVVVASVGLRTLARPAAVALIALAAAVTASGVAWTSVRTHHFADGIRATLAQGEPVLAVQLPHHLREAGAFYDPQARWLTAEIRAERPVAILVLDRAAIDAFTLVSRTRAGAPPRLGPYLRGRSVPAPLISDVTLHVTRYHRR